MDGVEAKPPAELSFHMATPETGTAMVTISGELDLGNIDQLAAAVDPVVAQGLERLILEVGELRFADSSAIAQWVSWSGQVESLELRNAPPLLRRVVTTMGLAGRLRLTP